MCTAMDLRLLLDTAAAREIVPLLAARRCPLGALPWPEHVSEGSAPAWQEGLAVEHAGGPYCERGPLSGMPLS